MRDCGIRLLLLALLVWPALAFCKQNNATNGSKAEQQSDTKSAPKEVENWKVLDDIKSGLQRREGFPLSSICTATLAIPTSFATMRGASGPRQADLPLLVLYPR